MPDGIPVATVGVGKARNAGLLAVRILGAHDDALRAQARRTPRRPRRRRVREKDRPAHGVEDRACASRRTRPCPSMPSARARRARRSPRPRGRGASRASPRGSCAAAASPPPARASARRPACARAPRPRRASSSSGTTSVISPQSSASARREHAVGERELQRAAQPDQAGQEPARRAVGREPDAGVGHHELRRLPRHDEVGRADEAHARAGRAPLHRGHHRRVAAHEVGDRRVQRRRGSRGGGWGGRRAPANALHVAAAAEPRARRPRGARPGRRDRRG